MHQRIYNCDTAQKVLVGACTSHAPCVLQMVRSLVPVQGPGSGHVLLYRGLRVRAGMHSGTTHETDVVVDTNTGRKRYSGGLLAIAKAVQDCAQGAMVLCSEATFCQVGCAGRSGIITVKDA
jgi:class 3 adenylate cyclase